MAGKGVFSVVIWPNHAGAVDERGEEPLSDPDYQRGQIGWGLNEQGRLVGHVRINVPRGTWTHILYCHTPAQPNFITVQKLSHPFVFSSPGTIKLLDITDDDVRPFDPDRVLHD